MTDQEFLEHCKSELIRSFENTKNGKSDDKQKFRTEGLLQAARLLGLMSADVANNIMEREHLRIFGESITARRARKASFTELKEKNIDEYFDIPAIERKS